MFSAGAKEQKVKQYNVLTKKSSKIISFMQSDDY